MELFTRLPDYIKILIITDFTGQFKMRIGKLITQLDKKFLNKMDHLVHKTRNRIIITNSHHNNLFNIIISLSIKMSENSYGEYKCDYIYDEENVSDTVMGYSQKWYTILIERNMFNNIEYKKTWLLEQNIYEENDSINSKILGSHIITEYESQN
jgi:hypothetical protein